MELNGRVALVTGGAHRVGRALSTALAHAGMRIAIDYHASDAEAKSLVSELEAAGLECRAYQFDLTRPDSPASLIGQVTSDFGGLDVLVNSAAVMQRTPVDEITGAAKTISIENLSQRLSVPPTGDELARLTEVWNTMLGRLESAVTTLSQFAADASHELRTPLAVIRTSAVRPSVGCWTTRTKAPASAVPTQP